MEKIKEQEFIEILKKFKDKTMIITLNGGIKNRIIIHKMDYKITDYEITIKDKRSGNFIALDLIQAFKARVNSKGDKLGINIDSGNCDIDVKIQKIGI